MMCKQMLASAGVSMILLAGCAGPGTTMTGQTIPVTTTASSSASSHVSGYGVVQSIDLVQRDQAGIGLGTVAGAVVGGVLGSQIGSGSGQTAATVAGAAGGAMVGNRMERSARSDQVYRVAIRMDNGSIQTLVQETPPVLQIGERVRLADGVVVERFR